MIHWNYSRLFLWWEGSCAIFSCHSCHVIWLLLCPWCESAELLLGLAQVVSVAAAGWTNSKWAAESRTHLLKWRWRKALWRVWEWKKEVMLSWCVVVVGCVMWCLRVWIWISKRYLFERLIHRVRACEVPRVYRIYPRKRTYFLKTYLYPGLGRENVPILKAEYVLSTFSTYYAYTP